MPRDRAVAALSLETRARRGPATATSASNAAHLALDPGHDAALRIEEALLHLLPAAKPELIDRELTRSHRNFFRFFRARSSRPGDSHCRRRPAARPASSGNGGTDWPSLVLARPEYGDRILDQNRRLRNDAGTFCPQVGEDRLVLVPRRTSPFPLTNVFSESRALLSWTTTFRNSLRRFACACLSLLPTFLQAPYAP